jgi:hypothetical protein
MILALARASAARLRAPRASISVVPWVLLAIGAAASARSSGLSTGADHVLRGTFAVAVLPLLAYALVSAVLGARGLRDATHGLVAIGGSPAGAALASVLVAMTASASTSGALAAIVCAIAHGSGDAPIASDLPASFGVAFAAGAAYAAYFSAGSAIGRGAARSVLLVVDFVVGGSGGFGAAFTPRAHVVALLGGATSFDLSRRGSSVLLVVLTVTYVAAAVRLGQRAPR